MDRVTYLDFDLLIQRRGAGYHTQVLTAPAGQADAAFSLPFSELELENFLLRIGRPRRSTRRIGSPEMEAARGFGGRLFEALFGGEVRSAFRSSLDEASRQHAGLRIRLRLADAPALSHLPWEFLYDPARHQFLVLSIETPLVRYLDLPERVRPLAVTPPIRVLVMISSPSDYPQLEVEQEWRKLHEALAPLEQRGLITLERLDRATLRALQRWLRQGACHIFHFIGHGGFDQASQDGLLILEDEHQRGRPVSGQDLGMLLHDHRLLRLAVLNACEGARTSQTDPFAGAAQSLVQHGIPAVIAMQFEITDTAAVTFAHEFYEAVADGYPVDAALAEARKAIFTQGNDIEWSTPVLYLRAPDGCIFDVERVTHAAVKLESQEEQRQSAALLSAAQAAVAAEDWAGAIEKLQMVLSLRPGHAEAAAQLRKAQEQREVAMLYASGQQHAAAGRWHEALDAFRQVQARQGDYQEVSARIAAAQDAITREEMPPVSPVSPEAISTATPQVPKARSFKARSFKARWLRSVLVLLVGVGGVLALVWWNTLDKQPDAISRQPSIVAIQAKTDEPSGASHQGAEEQYRKGEQYANGQGVAKDEAEAVKWYHKAAEQGHVAAQHTLGWIYVNGRGVTTDYTAAVQWYRQAAEQGHVAAQHTLGVMYASRGGPTNDTEAVKWYRQAADQGHTDAQNHLGWMYANGRGGLKDEAEAVKWYRKAADQGHAEAQNTLGVMYANGRGVPKDEAEAVQWYRKAAEQGHAEAQNSLGRMYANGRGISKDEAEAVKWYRKAADQGQPSGQNNLGVMYQNGRGVPKNDTEAVKWYRKAADQGQAWGQTNLGRMYADGRGVPKDDTEAVKWYRKAADQGHMTAQNSLRRMESLKAECPPDELSTLGKVVPMYVQWHKSRHAQWEEDEVKDPILEALAKEEEGQEGTARGRGAVFERMLPMLEAADAAKAKRVRSGTRASVVLQDLRDGKDERKEAVTRLDQAFRPSFNCLSKYRKAIEYLTTLNQMPHFPDPIVNPEGEIGGFLGAYMRKHAIVDHAQITHKIVSNALAHT